MGGCQKKCWLFSLSLSHTHIVLLCFFRVLFVYLNIDKINQKSIKFIDSRMFYWHFCVPQIHFDSRPSARAQTHLHRRKEIDKWTCAHKWKQWTFSDHSFRGNVMVSIIEVHNNVPLAHNVPLWTTVSSDLNSVQWALFLRSAIIRGCVEIAFGLIATIEFYLIHVFSAIARCDATRSVWDAVRCDRCAFSHFQILMD